MTTSPGRIPSRPRRWLRIARLGVMGFGLFGAATAFAAAPGPEARALWEQTRAEVEATYDTARGGYVMRAGVPCEPCIELSLAIARDGDATAMQRALATMSWARMLLDTVGGGYVHSSLDQGARSIRLEKRTDSNMRRLELLVALFSATRDSSWYHDAGFVGDYAERVLIDSRGSFMATQSAGPRIVPSVNGLALQAWIRWAALRENLKSRAFVWQCFDRIRTENWTAQLGWVRRDVFGGLSEAPQLADQVEMGRAHLIAFQLAGRTADSLAARMAADNVLERYEEPKGGFRTQFSPDKDGKPKRARQDFTENARAARFLAEMTAATGDGRYIEAAMRAWEAHAKLMAKSAWAGAEWAMAARASWAPEPPARSTWGAKPARPEPKRTPTKKPAASRKKA